MGIHDFSPESQDKVALAAYQKDGMGPWSSNKKLMGAVASGEQIVKVEPSSVASGVQQGMTGSSATTTAAVPAGAEQGNHPLTTATHEAPSLTDPATAQLPPPHGHQHD